MFIETFLIGSAIYFGFKKKKPKEIKKYSAKGKSNKRYYLQCSIASIGITGLAAFNPILIPLSITLLLYTEIPILVSAWQQWNKNKQIGHDFLFSIIIALGLISGQLFALAMSAFFYHMGKTSLAKTQNHSKSDLIKLFNQRVEKVWLIVGNVESKVSLESLSKGDCIVINSGDMIPIDGFIIEGFALIDQHTLTGESQPLEKVKQDQVFASTQVISGRIIIQVEKIGTETTAAKIGEMLSRTADYKVNLLSQGESISDKMAKPLIALAAVTLPSLGIVAANSVLCSTIGNRLRLTAPLSVLHHLNLATERGILVKDGRALESLSQIDTVLFDKTGTLTAEEPIIAQIILCSDYTEEQLLAKAAAAELKLAHPIAKAIVKKAHDNGLILPDIDESDFKIGLGVSVTVDDSVILVGSERFMHENTIAISQTIQDQMEIAYSLGHSIIFVAADNELKGLLEIKPSIRPEIKQMIKGLRQRGVKHLAIVSGDHKKPTEKLAKALKMDNYFAEVMPEDKAKIVADLQAQGRKVCFIGDGVNDAIAIKKADVSISIDGATSVACDLAQIVFMDGSLKHLCVLFDIAKSLEKNLNKSVNTLYLISFFNLTGALLLHFNLLITVLVNNASFLVTLKKVKQNNLN